LKKPITSLEPESLVGNYEFFGKQIDSNTISQVSAQWREYLKIMDDAGFTLTLTSRTERPFGQYWDYQNERWQQDFAGRIYKKKNCN